MQAAGESRPPPALHFYPRRIDSLMNIPASIALLVLAVAIVSDFLPYAAILVLVALGCLVVGWIGFRAVRQEVWLDGDGLVYRGLVRTVAIPRSALRGFDLHTEGWSSWLASVPSVIWVDDTGQRRRTRLWAFLENVNGISWGEADRQARRELLGAAVQAAASQARTEAKRRPPPPGAPQVNG